MENDHCKVKVGEYDVPLLFIPRIAGLEKCDCCSEDQLRFTPDFDNSEIKWAVIAGNGRNIYCNKCSKE